MRRIQSESKAKEPVLKITYITKLQQINMQEMFYFFDIYIGLFFIACEQLLPYYIVEALGVPCLPGILLAVLFSGALRLVSCSHDQPETTVQL